MRLFADAVATFGDTSVQPGCLDAFDIYDECYHRQLRGFCAGDPPIPVLRQVRRLSMVACIGRGVEGDLVLLLTLGVLFVAVPIMHDQIRHGVDKH